MGEWLKKMKAIINIEINSPILSVNIRNHSDDQETSSDVPYSYDKETLPIPSGSP